VSDIVVVDTGAQICLPAASPSTHREGVAMEWVLIPDQVSMLDYANEAVEDRKLDLELDAVHSRLVCSLDFVVTGELDSDEGDFEDENQDVDENEVF
jgi:hypothetical protein